MSEFVLREKSASKKLGKPIFFARMTRIGPCNTDKPEEAARFPTREEALSCPALRHVLSSYEIEETP